MLSYLPLWITMDKKNISAYRLVKDGIVSNSTLDRIRRNESVSIQTIHDLCMYIDCEITDIVEFLPDGSEILIEKQIKKLENKALSDRLLAYAEKIAANKKAVPDYKEKTIGNLKKTVIMSYKKKSQE